MPTPGGVIGSFSISAHFSTVSPPPMYCGDGSCNNGETQSSCCSDCGGCYVDPCLITPYSVGCAIDQPTCDGLCSPDSGSAVGGGVCELYGVGYDCNCYSDTNGVACADDGNSCTSDVCSSESCSHPNLPDGTPCTGGTCQSGTCTPPSCNNNGYCDSGESYTNCPDCCQPTQTRLTTSSECPDYCSGTSLCTYRTKTCGSDGNWGSCSAGSCNYNTACDCLDSDGLNYYAGGTCTDRNGVFSDSCSGTVNTEYSCSGLTCQPTTRDCQLDETLYCNAGNIYRDMWQCSGNACNNGAADTLEHTCSDTCTDTDGLNYNTQGIVTDNSLCLLGMTSCPLAAMYTDYCVDSTTVNEYTCSGNNYASQQHYCGSAVYGACNPSCGPGTQSVTTYSCSGGKCISSTSTQPCNTVCGCSLDSATITPNCAGGLSPDCEAGERITMSGTYTDDCSLASFYQIDAKSADGLCNLQYTGGQMIGINSTVSGLGISGGSFSGTWTIPIVNAACSGKTINPTAGALYDIGPPPSGWMDSTANVFGSFTFACVPKTCAQLGFTQCGSPSDGCGGTLSCGTCSGNNYCNSTGQCIPCTDTDGGINYNVGGTCTGGNGVFSDSCAGTVNTEYYCSNGNCLSTTNECQNSESLYCGTGNIFRDEWQCSGSPGYCNNGLADTLTQTCTDSCSDSDGGLVYTTQGTVTDNSLCSAGQTSCPSAATYTDSCIDATNLREYSCAGNNYASSAYNCLNLGAGYTCSSGRCVAPGFDFSLSSSPSSGSVVQSFSVSTTVNLNLVYAPTQPISLSCSGLPALASCVFSPTSCSPTCSSTMTISTQVLTPVGTSTVTVAGTGSVTRTATYTLTVNPLICSDTDGLNFYAAGTCNNNSVFSDSCSGTVNTEYSCSGLTCQPTTRDCQLDETLYCSAGNIYRDRWQCSGNACNNGAADTLEHTCSDTCTDSDGSNFNVQGTVTDINPCSAGQTSCPSAAIIDDSCINPTTVNESTCSGNSYVSVPHYCGSDVYGACVPTSGSCGPGTQSVTTYPCSAGKCTSSTSTQACNQPCGNCSLDSATITPNCAGGLNITACEAGETISMSGTYSGNCSIASFYQIDAKSADNLCNLQYTGGQMSGISSTISGLGISGGSFTGTWTIPAVNAMCLGKTITPTASALYDMGPPPSGWLNGTANVLGSFSFSQGCIRSNPTVVVSPITQNGNVVQPLSYSISVTNNDNSLCGPTLFTISNTCPAGWTCNRNKNSLLVANQATDSTATITLTPSASAATGTYPFNVTAANASYTNTNYGFASYIIDSVTTIITSSTTGSGYVTIDGTSYTTPASFNWPSGSSHTIAAVGPVSCGAGCQRIYSSWSDSGASSHVISPTSSQTYTANFQLQYYLTTLSSPSNFGTVGTVSNWYNVSQALTLQESPNATSVFLSWTGSGAGSYTGVNPSGSITVNGPITETANFIQQPCIFVSANFSSNCAGGLSVDCEQGEKINMNCSYNGYCEYADFLQIDAKSADNLCFVLHDNGNMSGVWNNSISPSGGRITATWTVPPIAPSCIGKIILPTAASLRDGGYPGVWVNSTTNVFGSFKFACIPKTCQDLGKTCDSGWSDGCGGTLSCGSCNSGYTCNATGQCNDITPPVTTIRCNKTACTPGCAYDDNINISLSCSDSGSGCKNILYCMTPSCTPNIPYTSEITMNEGLNYVGFNSVDNAGNSDPVGTQTVEINKTKIIVVNISTSSLGALKGIEFWSQITPAAPTIVVTFQPVAVLPPSNVTMTIAAKSSTPAGVYNITVFGMSEGVTKNTTYQFTVG